MRNNSIWTQRFPVRGNKSIMKLPRTSVRLFRVHHSHRSSLSPANSQAPFIQEFSLPAFPVASYLARIGPAAATTICSICHRGPSALLQIRCSEQQQQHLEETYWHTGRCLSYAHILRSNRALVTKGLVRLIPQMYLIRGKSAQKTLTDLSLWSSAKLPAALEMLRTLLRTR